MNKDQVLGMVVGGAIGDAFGAPFEFQYPDQIVAPDGYTTGGVHGVALGEYTDDTAMMLAAAEAYVESQDFSPDLIANNFKKWKTFGTYGTRDYVFDIGTTCSDALSAMSMQRPYAGKATIKSSGNGSIMRIAPAIAANHRNHLNAVGESVALALMTHGNSDTIKYITAFVAEVFNVDSHKFDKLKYFEAAMDGSLGTGSIMQAYNVALFSEWKARGDFLKALKIAVSFGYDTDTNACVTGMLVGARVGLSNIPEHLIKGLMNHDHILTISNSLCDLGDKR